MLHLLVEFKIVNKLNFKTYDTQGLSHQELMKLMGKSLLYIGNSISDGMPNTLLEALVMGAFPIQSNPGGATAEIIENGVNGFLIENPEDVDEIKSWISYFIENKKVMNKLQNVNFELFKANLDYDLNRKVVLQIYLDLNNI